MIHSSECKQARCEDSPFLREVQRLSVEARIPKAAILARPVDGVYRSFTFLPDVMRDMHLSILYSVAMKYPDSRFALVAAKPYSMVVWNWI